MPQILPIKELKNTAEISELCHKAEEPIFITKNGYGDMVLMSMEIYEKNLKMLEIYRALEESEEQVKNGEVVDAFACLRQMRAKYGI